MSNYRRHRIDGGCYFFTVVTAGRQPLLVEHVDELRAAFAYVMKRHPVRIDAAVVLPDHLHCIWTLPPGDRNFAMRWRLLKSHFSRSLPDLEPRSDHRRDRGERGIWQRRYWEHHIHDEVDYQRHCDYLHFNPVKHGYAERAADWPHSSFGRFVAAGVYSEDWASNAPDLETLFERCE